MTIKLPFEPFDEFRPKQEKGNRNADYGFLKNNVKAICSYTRIDGFILLT